MRRIGIAIAILALLLAAHPAIGSPDRLVEDIRERASRIEDQAEYTRKLLQKDQKELRAELASLQQEVTSNKQALASAKKTFEGLRQKEQELRQEISQEKKEIRQVEGIVSEAARRARSAFRESPVTHRNTKRLDVVNKILSSKEFPGMEAIRGLVRGLWTEMRASGKTASYSGQFTDPNGRLRTGEIQRVGALTAAYDLSGDGQGYLRTAKNGTLRAVEGESPWLTGWSLGSYLSGDSSALPLDISGGRVFTRWSEAKSVREWLASGGVLVWPILLIGAAALLLAGERFAFLLRIRANSDRIMEHVSDLAWRQKWQECRDYCRRFQRFPACRVLDSVLEHLGSTREVMENAVQESLLRQATRLERFVPTLSVLAAVAPLLGLLGTVTGMIATFQSITLHGSGDPSLMAGGISEALVTTQLGLAVAVPVMLLHHLLERRVDALVGDAEEKGNALILLLLQQDRPQREQE